MKFYNVYDADDDHTDFVGNADEICERYNTDYVSIQRAFDEEVKLAGLYYLVDVSEGVYKTFKKTHPDMYPKRKTSNRIIRCSSGVRFK